MPTLQTNLLSDLEAERESFLRHEQRIIHERNDILLNMRNHLDQLDAEIVRLGGKARDALPASSSSSISNNANGDSLGYISSIAPYPAIERNHSTSGESAVSQIVGGKKQKQQSAAATKKENKSSNKPKGGGRKRNKNTKSVDPDTIHNGLSWTCECGEHLSGDRARCGKCRKWRGGVRPKPKESTTTKEVAKKEPVATKGDDTNDTSTTEIVAATSRRKARTAGGRKIAVMPSVIDVYRNLPPASSDERKPPSSAEDETADILASFASGGINNTRVEVEQCLADMVFALTSVAGKAANNNANNNKRKRGRPKKDENVQLEPIQRVVSTSDSDNNSNSNDSVALFDTKQGRSKGESTQSVAAALESRQRIAKECLTYFNKVQTDIAEPTVYRDLVNAVEELAAGDVDEVDFVCQVLTLLDGQNDDLILGLNRILPEQYKIEMTDLQQQTGSAGSNKDAEEGKKKRRKTKPKVVEATTKAIVACVVSLAEAAKSGCKKCIAELESGQKTRREHSESCPRKQRRRSSSSASSKSSRSSTSSSD